MTADHDDQLTLDMVVTGTDPATVALLGLIAGDPIHKRDRSRITYAIQTEAREHARYVDPNHVRARLGTIWGIGVCPPVVGATYQALRRRGLLEVAGWTTSTDKAGRNSGKPCRVYRWTGAL